MYYHNIQSPSYHLNPSHQFKQRVQIKINLNKVIIKHIIYTCFCDRHKYDLAKIKLNVTKEFGQYNLTVSGLLFQTRQFSEIIYMV